jgi:hypothetical protein
MLKLVAYVFARFFSPNPAGVKARVDGGSVAVGSQERDSGFNSRLPLVRRNLLFYGRM